MCLLGHHGVGVWFRQIAGAAFVVSVISACASQPMGASAPGVPHVLLLYGDGRADDQLSLADSSYEALIRFDVHPDQGVPRRLWYRPAAAGTLQISVYEASQLDGPGELLEQHEQVAPNTVTWAAPAGRWLVHDLTSFKRFTRPTTVWVGIKKLAESPALWCSDRDAGHYYMRNSDPSRKVSLVPVRRAPLVQLELRP